MPSQHPQWMINGISGLMGNDRVIHGLTWLIWTCFSTNKSDGKLVSILDSPIKKNIVNINLSNHYLIPVQETWSIFWFSEFWSDISWPRMFQPLSGKERRRKCAPDDRVETQTVQHLRRGNYRRGNIPRWLLRSVEIWLWMNSMVYGRYNMI